MSTAQIQKLPGGTQVRALLFEGAVGGPGPQVLVCLLLMVLGSLKGRSIVALSGRALLLTQGRKVHKYRPTSGVGVSLSKPTSALIPYGLVDIRNFPCRFLFARLGKT